VQQQPPADRVGIALRRGGVDARTTRIGQAEQPRDLVEGLPRGVVDRLPEQFDVARQVAHEQQRGVTAILRNAYRLNDTVADLLLLDRANNTVGEGVARVNLAEVAATVRAEFEPPARGRELTLTGEADEVWVDGDVRQLERVLRNLLDNAMKFTGPGGVIGYRLRAVGTAAVLTVTDTGIGIPEADLAGLFTPFHRAVNAMDRAVQGSGLGLAIVRNIVAEHGGTVLAESQLGQGSTFTVTLPAVEAERPA
jgi:signal transduction histidine kinase